MKPVGCYGCWLVVVFAQVALGGCRQAWPQMWHLCAEHYASLPFPSSVRSRYSLTPESVFFDSGKKIREPNGIFFFSIPRCVFVFGAWTCGAPSASPVHVKARYTWFSCAGSPPLALEPKEERRKHPWSNVGATGPRDGESSASLDFCDTLWWHSPPMASL